MNATTCARQLISTHLEIINDCCRHCSFQSLTRCTWTWIMSSRWLNSWTQKVLICIRLQYSGLAHRELIYHCVRPCVALIFARISCMCAFKQRCRLIEWQNSYKWSGASKFEPIQKMRQLRYTDVQRENAAGVLTRWRAVHARKVPYRRIVQTWVRWNAETSPCEQLRTVQMRCCTRPEIDAIN